MALQGRWHAPARRDLPYLAASVGGYAFCFALVVWGIRAGIFVPGKLLSGDVRDVYDVAGDAFRAGRPVYVYGGEAPFLYSPPFTVLFGAFSWLPVAVTYAAITAANLAALWYVAGTLRRLGYLLWLVPIPFEIALGNVNLIVAAAIVAAVRSRRTALPAFVTLAKFAPALAVDPREWRRFCLWLGAGLAVTLPWLWLWPQWIEQMWQAWQAPVGHLVPIPFLARLPIALLLVATRTRLGRVTGAVLAIPAFYWLSLDMLVAPLAICFDLHDEGRLREFRLRRGSQAGLAGAAATGSKSGE